MFRPLEARAVVALLLAAAGAVALAQTKTGEGRYGLGRIATPEEIAGWDIDVRPDGHGVKKGRGTVSRGQQIYDAQCAMCHGVFGEQINFHQTPLVGGVRKEDLKTGRVAELAKPQPLRTTINKLNYATTLWDYINRAMPWTHPQSLSVDDVYAVTAYILHMGDIVPENFELNERNILTVQMPNRNGFTTKHGLGSVRGRPDVQGSTCMTNCVREVKITSEMPAYARNDHGNLAQQMRALGPVRGIDTTRYAAQPALLAAAPAPASSPAAADLVRQQGCTACHGVNQRIVGPAFADIGDKHRARADVEAYLVGKMKAGGSGVWGQVPMPPQPNLKDAEAKIIAQWILNGAK
jgi:cytochrome c